MSVVRETLMALRRAGLIVLLAVACTASGKFKCPSNSAFFYPCVCESGDEEGIQVHCENSNLASISVGLSNINVPVSRLRLYRCSFRRLYGDIFKAILVKELVIQDTPLTEVEEDVFAGVVEYLKAVRFLNATLGDGIPTKALNKLTRLEVLEIRGSHIPLLDADNMPALPHLKEIRLNYCRIASITATAFQKSNNLQRLDFHHNELSALPSGVFRNKRKATILDISFNNFTDLKANYFQDLNQMRWCNVSHNSIRSFDSKPFSRNTVLGLLNLSHNKIKKVDSNTFRSMRYLRRLFLNDNVISQIGRSPFRSNRRIGTINLARNKLKEVGTRLFEDLDQCEEISLEENEITSIRKDAFKGLALIAINISHNQLSSFENNSFVNVINITVFDLSHNRISRIPVGAFPGQSTYMTELRLQHNQIKSLGDVPFHFSGIKILNASYNTIEVIPKGTFPKLYELHTIDVSHNNLSDIGSSVFSTLFNIRHLDLSYNSLEKLKGSVFGSIPTMLSIDMSHNKIYDTSNGIVSNMISLRELNMQHNRITNIFKIPQALNYLYLQHNNISEIKPQHTWPQMNALLYLYLDHNNLSESIVGGTFSNLNSLNTLSLVNNSITEPPWQALSDLQTLQYLNLQNNNMRNITRGAFGKLPTLFELNLSNNSISAISKQAFEGLQQLIVLNMSSNQINHIPNDAFRGLIALRSLDLSRNYLNKVDNGTNGLFEDLLSIEKLNLSNNLFNTISKKMFPYHKWIPYKVKEVDLSYNTMPVLHKNLLIGLQKVRKLNFSHNIINDVRTGVLSNLTMLEVIDLSHNHLEALGLKVFAENGPLREVYMQGNQLVAVPADILMSNENLTLLDLRNNDLHQYYEDFVKRALSGTRIRMEGNPVECDCTLRRIRHWLSNRLHPELWKDVLCTSPPHLSGRYIHEILESELRCSDRRDFNNPEFQETPDIKFRSLASKKSAARGAIKVGWSVATRDDVGGFEVRVRNSSTGEAVMASELGYKYRYKKFTEVPSGEYEVCVVTLDSVGKKRPILPGQCDVFSVDGCAKSLPARMVLYLGYVCVLHYVFL